jgi:hypothetical protein
MGPLLMGLCRVLVCVTTAASIAGILPRDLLLAAAMALCYLIGLTYAAKQEDPKQPGRLWPLAFLGVAFVYGLPIAGGSFIASLFMPRCSLPWSGRCRSWFGATGPICPASCPHLSRAFVCSTHSS